MHHMSEVLALMGDGADLVSHSARAALTVIAKLTPCVYYDIPRLFLLIHCSGSDVRALVGNNLDYVVDALVHHLRYSPNPRSALRILQVSVIIFFVSLPLLNA